MHRAADDADIIDGIRQPHLRRNLLSHGRINLPVACLRPGARGIALRVFHPRGDAAICPQIKITLELYFHTLTNLCLCAP
jgi:hypothetical protein